jgi:hypothetical protein
MQKCGVLVLILFFMVTGYLTGCTETPEEIHDLDTQLVGAWQNQGMSSDILTIYSDGTYNIAEGETANWSTTAEGKLWIFGTVYSYSLQENDTILTLTQESFTKTYRRI